ncbi:MAG: hypothetical protein IH588_01415 [Anaerolineales bacterium]|nr:hypothetical protein [Anaerolineales bacterium]
MDSLTFPIEFNNEIDEVFKFRVGKNNAVAAILNIWWWAKVFSKHFLAQKSLDCLTGLLPDSRETENPHVGKSKLAMDA